MIGRRNCRKEIDRGGIRACHKKLLLRYTVQAVSVENQVLTEAVVEDSVTSTQYGFRSFLSTSVNSPGYRDARGPIGVIVNGILRLEAQAVT